MQWDHPRVCGEKFFEVGEIPHWVGSPPRVRGKELYAQAETDILGITPACAGKSCFG